MNENDLDRFLCYNWKKLENEPPLNVEIMFLWTDELEYGRMERGHVILRKSTGKRMFRYPFIGSLQPSHWWLIPAMNIPPLSPKVNNEVAC